jgi:YD repeat-containing protein
LECHSWLSIGSVNTLNPTDEFYGGIINGSWNNNNTLSHATVSPRYISAIQTHSDNKRIVIVFEDGKKMMSDYIYKSYKSNTTICSGVSNNSSCQSSNAYKDMDEVLTASAIKMKDAWVQDLSEVKPTIPSSDNLYKTGERGNWKPYEAYTYVKDRDKSVASTQRSSGYTNLEKDGTFNNVPVFDWKNPTYSNCFPEWRLSNTVISYNAYGYETENRDILDNHSAALYSYNGKLSVAVGNNAKSNELGFESFEEYAANNISPTNASTSHLTFFNGCSNYLPYRTDLYNVKSGIGNLAQLDMSMTGFDAYYQGNSVAGQEIKCEAEAGAVIANGNEEHPYEYVSGMQTIRNVVPSVGVGTPSAVVIIENPGISFKGTEDRCWNGQIAIPYALPLYSSDNTGKISFSNKKAHTGRISMEVKGETSFPQFNLKLEAGKKYVFGAWVNSDFTTMLPPNVLNDMISSTGWGIQLGYGKLGGTITQVGNFSSTSEPIDGWRRVEGTFTAPAGLTVEDLWFITVKPFGVSIPIYIDDMRIHPFDAGFQSYVYNPKDYKLVATLDANNFATFYSYDAEGNLFLVRRETEKGILTIEETKSNIKH